MANFLLARFGMNPVVSRVRPVDTRIRDGKARPHRILVCIDHSRPADACLEQAIVLARALGSELTLLHVMQPPGVPPLDALDWEISRQEARAHLERLEQQAVKALARPVLVRLEQGHAAERIVELAREIRADLTVLGSDRGDRATAWKLGTTVQQVVTVSRSSVFIAHMSATAPLAESPRRIVVPLDGSPRTESVLPTAARIASAYGAELILVHVTQELLPTSVLHSGEDLELASRLASRLKISAKAYLEGLRERLVREGVQVRTLVEHHANQRHCIVETSVRERADLIAVAAHGAACDPGRTFGTVTEYLLAHSAMPLLVLQDLPDSELHTPELGDKLAPPLLAHHSPECA